MFSRFRRSSMIERQTKGRMGLKVPSASPVPKSWQLWGTEELITFARTNVTGFSESHADVLRQQEIFGEDMVLITCADLERWGMPGGPARRLWQAFVRLTCPDAQKDIPNLTDKVSTEVLERCLPALLQGTQQALISISETIIRQHMQQHLKCSDTPRSGSGSGGSASSPTTTASESLGADSPRQGVEKDDEFTSDVGRQAILGLPLTKHTATTPPPRSTAVASVSHVAQPQSSKPLPVPAASIPLRSTTSKTRSRGLSFGSAAATKEMFAQSRVRSVSSDDFPQSADDAEATGSGQGSSSFPAQYTSSFGPFVSSSLLEGTSPQSNPTAKESDGLLARSPEPQKAPVRGVAKDLDFDEFTFLGGPNEACV